jgi:DNA topoisomerase-1
MDVVVVESPAKAKTINKYLGPGYKVLASYGHVRDLPAKDGSVDPTHSFAMTWTVDPRARKRLNDIADAVRHADRLILATDPDREGEAISWHVLEVLRDKKILNDVKVQRVAFNAVTRAAVKKAMEEPRDIDRQLVDAYLARRALDYLVGFTLSPVLWRKLPGARSAGRVQSVALRLICDRELEIENFRAREYWSVEADLISAEGAQFIARLVELDGKKLDKFDLANEAAARRAAQLIERGQLIVEDIQKRPTKRHPYAPFTTSTLQQEAARKLGFSASRTMQVAQRLYEGIDIDGDAVGLITYMRTDGVSITPEAVTAARDLIGKQFGKVYLPGAPREYKAKARNAQEAHEAIRPTDFSHRPKDAARYLDADQARLYELIWNRAVASQMQSADIERTSVTIAAESGKARLRANGSVIAFDGFLILYQEGHDDRDTSPSASEEDEDSANRLPALDKGDRPGLKDVRPEQHFTEPPPRFTEATLVKKLEELGIGRPSTYASVLSVLRDRKYVHMDRNRFIPEDKGRLVTAFLENFFGRYVEYDFTAQLEEELDAVSDGRLAWRDILTAFWTEFEKAVQGISGLRVSEVLDTLNKELGPHVFPPREDGSDPRSCPSCKSGILSIKIGRFGAFVGCSAYPECTYTRALTASDEDESNQGPTILGEDPESGLPISLRSGRFGPYVQLGEAQGKEKPKRAGIPRGIEVTDVNLELAIKLLSLPRLVGKHPESGEDIMAGIGRYGPFVSHNGAYATLDSVSDAFTIGPNRAVTMLAEKARRTSKRGSTALKELGQHPDDGKAVQVMNGRYGPYVKHGSINATLPRDRDPLSFTLEEALPLIEAKRGKGKGANKGGRTKGSAVKPTKKAAKKTTKKSAKSSSSANKNSANKNSANKNTKKIKKSADQDTSPQEAEKL